MTMNDLAELVTDPTLARLELTTARILADVLTSGVLA